MQFGEQQMKTETVASKDGSVDFAKESSFEFTVKEGEAGAMKLLLVEDTLLTVSACLLQSTSQNGGATY